MTVSVPAWTSYTVKYNANGGTGAPGNQTKWKGQTLKLSSTIPTRTGYSFLGWSTSSTATSATYKAGGDYTSDSGTTLYAVWKANTYQVTFDANGGTGAPGAQTKTYGKTLTLSSTKPTRTNYNFLGWGTSASTKTVSYKPGGSYTSNAAIKLYAIWELAYTKPRITGLTAKRCDKEGEPTEDGTYALVSFTWACDRASPTITIECVGSAGTKTKSLTGSDNDGDVSETIGDGELSTDSSYTIIATVTDSDGTYSRSVTINSNVYPIDFLAGGKGVAFGKSAEKSGCAEFAFNATFGNTNAIYGIDGSGNNRNALVPLNENGHTLLGYGNYTAGSGGTYVCGHDVYISVSNTASGATSYQPYFRQGSSATITLRTSGFVTNGGSEVHFWIPLTKPVIGSPTVSLAGNQFLLRQNNSYTHGSAYNSTEGYTYASVSKVEASVSYYSGIFVKATFSVKDNVTNNDAIGIYWNGTITFSSKET